MGKRGTIFRLGLGFLLAQPPLTKRPVRCGAHAPRSVAARARPAPRHLLLAGPVRVPRVLPARCAVPVLGPWRPPPHPARPAAPGELRSLCPLS